TEHGVSHRIVTARCVRQVELGEALKRPQRDPHQQQRADESCGAQQDHDLLTAKHAEQCGSLGLGKKTAHYLENKPRRSLSAGCGRSNALTKPEGASRGSLKAASHISEGPSHEGLTHSELTNKRREQLRGSHPLRPGIDIAALGSP